MLTMFLVLFIVLSLVMTGLFVWRMFVYDSKESPRISEVTCLTIRVNLLDSIRSVASKSIFCMCSLKFTHVFSFKSNYALILTIKFTLHFAKNKNFK